MGAKIIEDSLVLVAMILATSGAFTAGMIVSGLACGHLLTGKINGWLESLCMVFCSQAYKQYRARELGEGLASGRIKIRFYIGEGANRREVT
jgi:hypothetical protein